MNKKTLEEIIYISLDETAEMLPGNIKFGKGKDIEIYSGNGILDSLGLVTFLVNLEQKLVDETGVQITIADDKAFSEKNSPFRTVSSLSDYILSLLN